MQTFIVFALVFGESDDDDENENDDAFFKRVRARARRATGKHRADVQTRTDFILVYRFRRRSFERAQQPVVVVVVRR
jgi:hypothetical protein